MQEFVSVVVVDILTMVAGVEPCRLASRRREYGREFVEELVGEADGVVVGIHKLQPVLILSLRLVVGQEMCHVARIALVVLKVTAVGVENDKLLLPALFQDAF